MQLYRGNESGNTFLMIIIGIFLFGALMFALSRGMNESPSHISARQAKVTASDIIAYSQQLTRSVSRMRQKGCSENDISLVNSYVSGYGHTPAVPVECRVFHLDGGKISYKEKTDGIEDIIFTGSNYIEGAGNDCAAVTCTDLTVIFKVNGTICEALNNILNIGPFAEEPGTFDLSKFTGDFSHAEQITSAGGHSAACINDTGKGGNFFYSVILAR